MSAIERDGVATPGGTGLRQKDGISEMPYAAMARNAVAYLPLDPESMRRAIHGVEGTVARFLPLTPREWSTTTKILFMTAIYGASSASLSPERRAAMGFLGRRSTERRARGWKEVLEQVYPQRVDVGDGETVPEYAEYYEGLGVKASAAPH